MNNAADNWQTYFLWLAGQAVSVPLAFWPATAAVVAAAFCALAVGWRGIPRVSIRSWLLLTSFYLAPAVVLLWAALMSPYTSASRWPTYALEFFLLLAGCFAAFFVWRAVGFRLVAFATVLPALWLSLCASFIAAMSLADDWL